MQLHFNSIYESIPGPKWQKLFYERWPAYKAWLDANISEKTASTRTSLRALREYMPEMVPIHQNLCHLVNADEQALRFLTGFQPPAYYSACSQAVSTKGTVQLIRNYDYHPDQIEGILKLSSWHGKKVMASSDSLIGAIDGMNEDGLAVSLTFGGRQVVGFGFGIPFILRYVLEFCSTVAEAVEVLMRVPSHMSYNVTLVDRSGAFKTLQLAPDRSTLVTDATFSVNHQNPEEWPENAIFNKTFERETFLKETLSDKELSAQALADSFSQPPLYNNLFSEGLGTLYTAIYSPLEGTVQLRWPNDFMIQNLNNFHEETRLITFNQSPSLPKKRRKTKSFKQL